MAGLVNRHTSHILPLKASSIFAEVNGFGARLLATLTYYNDCEYDIEGLFVFPQDERTTVVEFEATIEERHVSTEIREKCSIVASISAYALEEREDELFSLSIGRIPPLASVFVQVGLITELLSDLQTRGSLFVLPSVFTPRLYNKDENEIKQDLHGSQMLISDLPRKTHEIYSFDLQLEVVAPCLLAGCSSRTHAIQVDADSRATNASRIHVTIAEPHTYDRELEVLLHLSHPFDPHVLIEEGKKVLIRADSTQNTPATNTHEEMIEKFAQNPAIMITFTPHLNPPKKPSSEYIFLVDRSGSMSGKHIFQVKETLILFMKSLPSNSFFNIVGFGSYYRSLFQESREYNDENVDKAMTYVNKMRADLGGTNLILPLEFIFDRPSKRGRPRIIFLLTDGGVSNTLDVVDLVRKHSHTCRFFTFGIGPEACPHLVQGVAGPSKGKSWFITDENRITPKVMDALDCALRPAITDIEVSWHLPDGYDVIQSPNRVPYVFDSERLVLYGLLSRSLEDEDKYDSPRTSHKRRMDRTMRSFSNNSVKVFWFDDDMEYLPEDQLLPEMDEQEQLQADDDVFCGRSEANEDTTAETRPSPSPLPRGRFIGTDVFFGDFFKDLDQSCDSLDYTINKKSVEPLTIQNGEPESPFINISPTSSPFIRRKLFSRKNPSKLAQSDAEERTEINLEIRRKSDTCASANEKSAYQQSPRYYERDSGVGFSMDDADKPFEDDSANNDIDGRKASPTTVDTTSNSENIDENSEFKCRIFKNSDLLKEIGVPQNFAAVEIKGFVGDEEVKQVIPFPINRSGGSSKRPTIHQLLARSLIRELQISEEIDEGTMRKIGMITDQSKIHCRFTAFTSVDQYCYEDEILSALQFVTREDVEAEKKRKVLTLERKGGFTTGLGRRLPTPEGSDQETIESETCMSDTPLMGDGEEPTDLYRLDRSPTIESSDSSPIKSVDNSPRHITNYAGRPVPPLSSRYVVGEKRGTGLTEEIASPRSDRVSSVLPKLFKDYQPYVSLAKLQSRAGYWELTDEFAHCLGLLLYSIQQASPLADSTVCTSVSEELQEILRNFKCDCGTQIWATALGLAWLCHLHGDALNEWFLLARKADTWLGECEYPRGFTKTDMKKSAYQALLLMRKNSSDSSRKDSTLDKVGDFEWPVF